MVKLGLFNSSNGIIMELLVISDEKVTHKMMSVKWLWNDCHKLIIIQIQLVENVSVGQDWWLARLKSNIFSWVTFILIFFCSF